MKRLILLALMAACSSSGPALDTATIGSLSFGVPSGWERKELSNHDRAMAEWTPAADDNERKEALTVVRTERPAMAKATPRQLQRSLADAQRHLPLGTFSAPTSFTTRHGLRGVRVEGQFVPPGRGTPYRRIHAVLVDGTALVNVLYTARELDRESFDAVLDSFIGKGA